MYLGQGERTGGAAPPAGSAIPSSATCTAILQITQRGKSRPIRTVEPGAAQVTLNGCVESGATLALAFVLGRPNKERLWKN